MGRVAVMSIRSNFAEAIYNGTKLHEFRRTLTSFERGDRVLIYEPLPKGMVTGEFTVDTVQVLRAPFVLESLETDPSTIRGVTDYLAGSNRASAIKIAAPERWSLARPLRDVVPNVRAPQSYLFVRA